jgi:formylglycine-generating enzyme required for sulfatase activity
MTFTPNDTKNYNTLTQDVEIVVTANPDTFIEMVRIPAGTFMMGSAEGEPGHSKNEEQHLVTLPDDFYMSKYVVTQKLCKIVIGSSFDYAAPPGEISELLPESHLTWYETLEFCNRLSVMEGLSPAYIINNSTDPEDWGPYTNGYDPVRDTVEIVPGSKGYRIPTEEQWEYACRAGTKTAYYMGDTFSSDMGWYNGNTTVIHQVGLKPPNPWGLYDMAGNMYEWCWEVGERMFSVAGNPPLSVWRRVRGGCYNVGSYTLRSAHRYSLLGYGAYRETGARLVRPL